LIYKISELSFFHALKVLDSLKAVSKCYKIDSEGWSSKQNSTLMVD